MRKIIPSRCGLSTTVLSKVRGDLIAAGLEGRGVLVALSGGLDSTCLVRLLTLADLGWGGRVEIAHVDHGLRVDSEADAQFCRSVAQELGCPFHLLRLRREDLQGPRGVQAEARSLRRAFFEETLATRKLDAVALGHHADDQAETILWRLIRGTGPRGTGGMRVWSPPYVRPLLGLRRADLEALAEESGWVFRQDPTNLNVRYVRNRIRHEILPMLRTLNPSVEAALCRLSRLLREDDAWLSQDALRSLERLGRREPEGLRFAVEDLKTLGGPIRRRLWLAAWQAVGGDPAQLESLHLETVDELLEPGRPQRRASIPGQAAIVRCWDHVWVLRPDAFVALRSELRVTGKGRVPLGVFDVAAVWGEPATSNEAVLFPGGRPKGELMLRPRRPGDRIDSQKVKDLLMEVRTPAWRRARAIVVEDREGVLGVLAPGWARSCEKGAQNPQKQGIWLEEGGEKRWCPRGDCAI